MSKRMTIKRVLDAIAKNGKEKIRGSYYAYEWSGDSLYKGTSFRQKGKKLLAGCALGQAGYNLGVDAGNLDFALSESCIYVEGFPINKRIKQLNDSSPMTLPEIAKHIESHLSKDTLKEVIEVD